MIFPDHVAQQYYTVYYIIVIDLALPPTMGEVTKIGGGGVNFQRSLQKARGDEGSAPGRKSYTLYRKRKHLPRPNFVSS